MHLFVIPSWYPSPRRPLQGIFIQEQVLAIGEKRPEWTVTVSCGSHGAFDMPLRQWYRWPAITFDYLKQKQRKQLSLRSNVTEFHEPIFHWNERFLVSQRRYCHRAFVACRRSFVRALQNYGKIDCIHAHVVMPAGVIAEKLSSEFGIPYVITEHAGPFPFPHFLQSEGQLKVDIARAYRNAKMTIGVSPAQVQRLEAWNIKSTVIPNCIDEDFFQPSETLARNNKFTFFSLCLGLTTSKGIDDLLQAICIIKERHPAKIRDLHFRVGGDGYHPYRTLAGRLGIDDHIEWLGTLNRKESLTAFQQCDCFVLPSHQESFGMVYLEALACGKPVIATRCGGGEYIVEPGLGTLIDIRKPEEVAEAIIQTASLPSKITVQERRRCALERFSKEVVVKQLQSLYGEKETGC